MNDLIFFLGHNHVGTDPYGLKWARSFDELMRERYPQLVEYVRKVVPHEFDDRPESVRRALALQPMAGFIRLTRVEVPPLGEFSFHPRRVPIMVRVVEGFDVQGDGVLCNGLLSSDPCRPAAPPMSNGALSMSLYAPPQ